MRSLLGGLTLAALVAVPASAQTADDIIAKILEAKGGVAKQKAVQSVRMTGRVSMGPGVDTAIVIEMKRPRSLRIDVALQGSTITQAYDGTVGWVLNPFSGHVGPDALPAEATRVMEEQADMDGPLVDYAAKGHSVELVGREFVQGADCYRINVTLRNGDARTFFIDAGSYLEVKVESRLLVQGAEQLGDILVGDWRDVGGILMAHSIDSGLPGAARRQKVTIDKVELNVPLDDARFRMPARR